MQVDSYFSIGTSHNICEDYALHGYVNDRAFGVLSDGCSSSQYTDFGSRFLCLATQEVMTVSPRNDFLKDAVLPYACSLVGTTLPWECLDATVMVVYSSKFHLIARVVGDGVVVARNRNGTFHILEIEFSNNAPGYLTYTLDNYRYNALKQGNGGIRIVTETKWDPSFSKKLSGPIITKHSLGSQPNAFWYNEAMYPHIDFDLIAVFSDGVSSFQQRSEGVNFSLSLPDVLRRLTAFKGLRGEFVKRRCRRFFKKFCAKNDWSHYDDFSMVALYNDDDSNDEKENK